MQAVQASQPLELYRRLFEGSPVASAISRLEDGAIFLFNDGFLALTGYAREELAGRTTTALRVWADAGERARFMEQLRSAGSVPAFVHGIRRKSGELVQVVAAACLIDIEGVGHILGQLIYLRDLDAAHAALRERDAQLRQAERGAQFGVWNLEAATNRLEWSEGMKRLCGLAQDAFRGTFDDFLALIHPDDRTRFLAERKAGLESGQTAQIEYRICRADGGGVRWLRSRATPRLDPAGKVVATYGMAIDVTQEKEREQLLMLQSQIMANMAEGVALVSNADGRIVFANARYEQMFGFRTGELQGRHISIVNAAGDRGPVEVAEAIMAELRRSGTWRGDVKNRRADGSEFWTHATVSAFDHAEHGPVWITVQNDVNEARIAQRARDAAHAELSRLTANQEASIERERSAIARDVHDQLGAALTGIRMRLEALATQHAPDPAVYRAGLLEVAATAQSALAAARAICDRLRPPILDDLGLAETCRWSVQQWARDSGTRALVRLREPMPAPDPEVSTDLFRALQELLTNVARHSGATLVQVRLLATPKAVRLRVADNGRGFDAQRRKSRGLGLISLRERAARHDGAVRIRSSAQGTVVSISLPLHGKP